MALTDHQQVIFSQVITDIHKGLSGNPDYSIITLSGFAGCVDMDTEYLTETGWKKISNYTGEKILQWNPDGSTDFIIPEYTKVPANKMNHVETKTIDMVLSDGHRVPHLTSKNKFKVKSFFEFKKQANFKIPRSFKSPNLNGIDLSDELIRILIMQSADGHIIPQKRFKIAINVKRTDKKERVLKLLDDAGIDYKIHKSGIDYIRVVYFPPESIKTKDLSVLWGCSDSQLKISYDEIVRWDGSISKRKNVKTKRFTGNKNNVDVCQYIFSVVSGNYSSISKDNREYKNNDIFSVSESSRNTSIIELNGIRGDGTKVKNKIKSFIPVDGYQYCFTTPSSFWLARRNGKIFPTGNTGKTFLLSELIKYFNNYKQTVTAPTHKAVGVITDTLKENGCPKIDSRTIHSYLKLKLEDDCDTGKKKLTQNLFGKDAVDQKFDILYTDESSMVSDELLNYAMEKINGGDLKVIVLIGDQYQLLPVDDDETSEFIKNEVEHTLTKPVRQAEGSPILSTSWEIKDIIDSKQYPIVDASLFPKLTVVANRKEFMTKYFADSESDKMVGTYTNKMVIRYNDYIRKLTKDSPEESIIIGDELCFYDTFYKGEQLIHLNSEVITVKSCVKQYDEKHKVSYWNVFDEKGIGFPVLDFADQPRFSKTLEGLADVANGTNDRKVRNMKWSQYFALKNKYANVRYNFSSTLHRLQGSTLDSVYLDLTDMENTDYQGRYHYDRDTVFRLIYVGITRARNEVVILL